MPTNYKVSSDIDTFLKKSTKEEAAAFLGLEDEKAEWGKITGTLSSQSDLNSALNLKASASDVATNTSDIATNTSNIATNTSNVATNTSDIATNTSDIATNTSNIATNTSNIATNTSSIATNTANIATNTSDISDLEDSADAIATVVTGLSATGTGDNSAKIQAVIDAVAADGGGDIVIPAGTWDISSTIEISTSNIRLRGEGGDWNHDTGGQGTQAATTLKWTGTEYDGSAVANGSLDGSGGVSHNGTRLNDSNLSLSDHELQGMVVSLSESGGARRDLIMESGSDFFEVKPDSNVSWANYSTYYIYKPSVMVEVHSVYSDGVNDQQITGSGVSQIHFDCQNAHIGLRVIAANNGDYRDLSFIEPKTAAIYMGVKNIGSMNKPAVISQDPQFNHFENIVSRNFTSGQYGGIFVCNGISDWVSNTSFNHFKDMRSYHRYGDGIVMGSSDANTFEKVLMYRAGIGADGHGVKLLGSNTNSSGGGVPRTNRFILCGASQGGQILCYGTSAGDSGNTNDVDIYASGPSHDNEFVWLNIDNGTPLPQVGYAASAYYDTDGGHSYEQKAIQMVVSNSPTTANSARDDIGAESLRIVNGADAHVVYSNGTDKWRTYIENSSGDFIIDKMAGSGVLKLDSKFETNGTRKNIRLIENTDGSVLQTDDTILISAATQSVIVYLIGTQFVETGDIVTFKCIDATNTVTIGRNGNPIDGAHANLTLALNEAVTLQYYGENWNIISRS